MCGFHAPLFRTILAAMNALPLRFFYRDAVVALNNVPPDRTVLELLREDLHCTAAKEGCASGDCGACTVTVAEARGDRLEYRAINSCIRLAHSIDGMALWTAQDIAAKDGTLHPAQRAMLECHGSQCGFCTPGFVMSLFALHRQRGGDVQGLTRHDAHTALSGNLCRCTGYRPIIDAALTQQHWPVPPHDEAALLQKLQQWALDAADEPAAVAAAAAPQPWYARPATLAGLLALRAAHPQAALVAGSTDLGLWVTKQHRRQPQLIDVTRVAELRRVKRTTTQLQIGAAATLHEAFAALAADRPGLQGFFDRFAGLPIRHSGTLGGNVANGSPIGDSMPLLIALGAQLVLASVRGERALPIEDFYLAYRQTALAPDEVLARIDVPLPGADEVLRADKISKRFEDDISAVCLALALRVQGGVITQARVGAGGVAAVPARARQTEAALLGQPWTLATIDAAAAVLSAEFSPISDMRASSHYRRTVLGNLLRRFWLERQPGAAPSLFELHALESH